MLAALRAIEARRARLPAPPPPAAREWSNLIDLAAEVGDAPGPVEAALGEAIAAGLVQEHEDWPGYFRLTAAAR